MTVSVDAGNGETANWYDGFGNLVASRQYYIYCTCLAGNFYGNYLVYSENSNGYSSEEFLSIDLYQIPLPPAPSAPSPIDYCIG